MDTIESNLVVIKDGIKDVIHKYEVQENRLNALEKDWTAKKKAGFAGLSSSSQSDFSIVKAVYAMDAQQRGKRNAWDGAERERDILESATGKALDTGTPGSGGGYVVPQEYVADIIEMMRAQACVTRAGATILRKLKGSPVRIPKQTGSGTVYWIGQNATIAPSDATFGEIQLTPKTMAMRMQVSNLGSALSNPALEQVLRENLAKTAALELDRVALRGSGSSNQPLGIANMAGISTYAIGTNGGPLAVNDMYGMAGLVEDANAAGSKLALITHPRGLRKLKTQRIAQFSGDSGGMYAFQPSLLTDEALSKAVGVPCLSTTQLPVNLTKGSSSDCTEVYFGDFSSLIIGMWGDMEILATNIGGNAWTQNAIEVRLVFNVDIQVRHSESFVLCNDARTT